MVLLFLSRHDDAGRWREALGKELPDLDFRAGPDAIGDPAEIDVALVWGDWGDVLAGLPNLKAILSLGAGVDHLFKGRAPPEGVPVARLLDPGLTTGMSEYVVYWVLHHHRRFGDYARSQAERRWKPLPQRAPGSLRVGLMGLGVMGTDAIERLRPFGFNLAGWSRTEKTVAGIETFAGADGLGPFLARTDILVCLLPLTRETAGIVNQETLARLPAGAVVINAARGGHVVDHDLLAALESGHVAAAVLDVFHTEPLPEDHPFWIHPRVAVTPHAASLTVPETAALPVAENVRRIRAGKPPAPLVDPETGY